MPREYKYQLFYMSPPIKQSIKPNTHRFKALCWDDANVKAKQFIAGKDMPAGTVILMLAQLDR